MRRPEPSARLYRGYTMLSDLALVIGAVMLGIGIVVPVANRLPWIIAGGLIGLISVAARSVSLRYKP